jgi:uncharacterized protein (DUF1800 family)
MLKQLPLRVFRWAALGLALGVAGCATPPGSSSGGPGDAYVWLNRLTWGASPMMLEGPVPASFDAYLQDQLYPPIARLPAAAANQIQEMTISQWPLVDLVQDIDQRHRDANALPTDEERRAAANRATRESSRLMREVETRHILRALYSPNQIQEQMTWFWMNHFNVNHYKVGLFLGDYEETVVRPQALGKFRDLLAGVVYHPAMLRYLDNERNAVRQINENFARELMELHTLGVDGGYTQRDVQELARLLTGVGINTQKTTPVIRDDLKADYVRRGLFEFNPVRHDFGSKVFLGQPIQSRGLAEMDEVIDRLARHPATARFISRKMALFWLSDEPPPELVERMSQTFTRSGGDIAQTLKTLLTSPQWAQASGHAFKDPFRYVISSVRLAYDAPCIVNVTSILNWLGRLGEPLFSRVTPDGYPMVRSAWDGPGQMALRFEVGKAMGSGPAGMFNMAGPQPQEKSAFPQLSNALYFQSIRPTLSAGTRQGLAQAGSAVEWNAFLLSSPEMMVR